MSSSESKVTVFPNSRQLLEAYKAKQGLGKEDSDALGMNLVEPGSETALALQRIFGYSIKSPCVTITCPSWPESYLRLRILGAVKSGSSKYLSPKNSSHGHPYLTPGLDWPSIKADASVPIIITEGEITAYWGCKKGGTVVGLPGVTMIAPLFDGSWEWSGRTVSVAFDHDEGYLAGTYKPEVAGALGRLCDKLMLAGVNVNVLDIGKVCSDPTQKWGLDDYLRTGGSWEALLSTAHEPPEWCEHMAFFNENCVYVRADKPHIWNKLDGTRQSKTDFLTTHSNRQRPIISRRADAPPRTEFLANTWLQSPNRPDAREYVFDPSEPTGYLPDRLAINAWQGWPDWERVRGINGDCSDIIPDFDHYLNRIFGEHKDLFCCWVAHLLNRPQDPTSLAWYIRSSIQGIGKSLIGEVLVQLTGVHGGSIPATRVFDKFASADTANIIMTLVDEIDVLNTVKPGQIRDMITRTHEYIELKGLTAFKIAHRKRYLFTSNSPSGMKLESNNRRVVVIRPNITKAEAIEHGWSEYLKKFLAPAINPKVVGENQGYLAEVYHHFVTYDGWEEFDPLMDAPQTAAGLEVIEAGEDSGDNAIRQFIEAVEGEEWFALRSSVSPGENRLYSKLKDELSTIYAVARKQVSEDGAKSYMTVFSRDYIQLKTKSDGTRHENLVDPRVPPSDVKASASKWGMVWSQFVDGIKPIGRSKF